MNTINHLEWNLQEFQTYLLLYCASIDLDQSAEELHFIKSHVAKSDFSGIQKVFNNDTDYNSLIRIQQYVKENNLSEEQLQNSFTDIKLLFKIDDDYSTMEKHLFNVLKSLLNG